MFILYSISSSLEFWTVIDNLIYENSELNVFKNINFLEKISDNYPNNLLGIKVYKILVGNCCLQY